MMYVCVCAVLDLGITLLSHITRANILLKLKYKFNIKYTECPPCCLGQLSYDTPSETMVWNPSNQEDALENVRKVRLADLTWWPVLRGMHIT